MTYLFPIIMYLITAIGYNPVSNDILINNVINNIYTENLQKENLSMTYTTQTRGFYEEIRLSKSSLKISNERNGKDSVIHKVSEKDWQEIQHIMTTLDLENISQLKVPTENRYADRVLIAGLAITSHEKNFITPEFDHGNPPKEIRKLVDKILSLKKVALKQ